MIQGICHLGIHIYTWALVGGGGAMACLAACLAGHLVVQVGRPLVCRATRPVRAGNPPYAQR